MKKGSLKHYGTPRRSGRYPWGSGDEPYQGDSSFLSRFEELRKNGSSETEIARALGMTTTELRSRKTVEVNKKRAADAAFAYRLHSKGLSNTAIAERMGLNESSVRGLLDPSLKVRGQVLQQTSAILKESLSKNGFVDVGSGNEAYLGVSRTKLDAALESLKAEGYTVHTIPIEQQGTGKYTWTKVLANPGIETSEVSRNREKIRPVLGYSEDGGMSFKKILPPKEISMDRIHIRYPDEGGLDKDGVIELRRGVDDLSLGSSSYAQVRIAVSGKKYMKGMAVYSDDIPAGKDIVYNTSKKDPAKVFKDMEPDPDYPFGSVIRQKTYLQDGKEHLSAINVLGTKEGSGEEGSWETWSRNLSSQFLSKQTPALARQQLGLAQNLKEEELEEILSLTNPAVKQALLKPYADSCDSAAVHLKAAAMPRQASHVILPVPTMKPGEVYAPNYKNGENVVLIRHPHGGTFEIPELIVNNRHPDAKKLLGNAPDAIGIHPSVAAVLSGADFDGDTVIVIPNKSGAIKTSKPLKGLKNFNAREAYPGYPGMRVMDDKREKGIEMGKISNLITDMSIKGASPDEIARAVRHSMVVIDAPKHKLNWEESYIQNGIASLRKKYQGGEKRGASTLISKASAEVRVDERVERRVKKGEEYKGEKLYKETGRTFVKGRFVVKDGKKVYLDDGPTLLRKTKVTRMELEEDARALSSGTVMEGVYADYANSMKALARKARIALQNTPNQHYSPSARETYKEEVGNLKAQLRLALRNAPLERRAQILANKIVREKKKANPGLDGDAIKKIKGQELTNARLAVGAKKVKISISDRQWEAIQAGAVSHNTLLSILANADLDSLKQRAMPRSSRILSPARTARARILLNQGYTRSEVADALGVSVNALDEAVQEN